MNCSNHMGVLSTVNGDLTIRTRKSIDFNIFFETSVLLKGRERYETIEIYNTEEDAIKGHERYCNMSDKDIKEENKVLMQIKKEIDFQNSLNEIKAELKKTWFYKLAEFLADKLNNFILKISN